MLKGFIKRLSGKDGADETSAPAAQGLTEAALLPRLEAVLGDGWARLGGVSVSGAQAFVSLEVEADQAATLEPQRQAVIDALEEIPGVEKAVVVLTAERSGGTAPARPAAPSEGSKPQPAQQRTPPPPQRAAGHRPLGGGPPKPEKLDQIRHVIAVSSGKGGVGKSTTAVNLALAMKAQGLKVGLMDADIHGPSLKRMMGITLTTEDQREKGLVPAEAHGIPVMSMALMVEEDNAMVWRGPMVMGAVRQMLFDVDWPPLDVLVVDMPPGTGDAHLTLAQRVTLSGAVIVSTPQDIALIDARKAVSMYAKTNVPVLGIIENMSHFTCPHCGERTEIFAHGGARDEADRMQVPFLGEIPLDPAIRLNGDAGTPVMVAEPEGPHAEAYAKVATSIAGLLKLESEAANG
ncbi:MAG: Mrp/NBP35 family ATP-binding protein [Alphaproteobacteria bacterium]